MWIDRRTGQIIAVTTEPFDGSVRVGVVRVRTYRDILNAYLTHPEAKSLAPDGQPIGRNTRGFLRFRPVRGVLPAHYIGKEANRLDERIYGLVDTTDDYLNEYIDPADRFWRELVLLVLDDIPRGVLAEQLGADRGTVRRWFKGARPHPRTRDGALEIAVDQASRELRASHHAVPRDAYAVLQRYLELQARIRAAP